MSNMMAKLHDDVDEYLQAFYASSRRLEDMTDLTNCGSIDHNEKEGEGE